MGAVTGRAQQDEFTDFVGRQGELAQIAAMLERGRLVTVVGPGGVGKTRVSLCAAAQAAGNYPDGVWIVEQSGLRDPLLLPNTVASVLGLPEQDARSALDALLEYLRDKRLLLILDTCEHLLDACADLIQAILPEAPGVTVLATSRQPLDTLGEQNFAVQPLPVPDSDTVELDRGDAVELFALRAAAAVPGLHGHRGQRGRRDRPLPPPRRHTARDRAGGGAAARAGRWTSSASGSTTGSRC